MVDAELRVIDPIIPENIVFVDTTDPNTATIFDDENPLGADDPLLRGSNQYAYIGSDGSLWLWNGSSYYTLPNPPKTEYYITGTTADAGSNKTGIVYRTGSEFIGADVSGFPLTNLALSNYKTGTFGNQITTAYDVANIMLANVSRAFIGIDPVNGVDGLWYGSYLVANATLPTTYFKTWEAAVDFANKLRVDALLFIIRNTTDASPLLTVASRAIYCKQVAIYGLTQQYMQFNAVLNINAGSFQTQNVGISLNINDAISVTGCYSLLSTPIKILAGVTNAGIVIAVGGTVMFTLDTTDPNITFFANNQSLCREGGTGSATIQVGNTVVFQTGTFTGLKLILDSSDGAQVCLGDSVIIPANLAIPCGYISRNTVVQGMLSDATNPDWMADFYSYNYVAGSLTPIRTTQMTSSTPDATGGVYKMVVVDATGVFRPLGSFQGLSKSRFIPQALTVGANTVTHNLNLPTPFKQFIVESRNDLDGTVYVFKIDSYTANSFTFTSTVAITLVNYNIISTV